MCGICGVVGPSLTKSERSLFHNLLMLNYFRGEDSTGIIRIEKEQVRTHRTLEPSPNFLFTDRAREYIRGDGPAGKPFATPQGFIGHCRAATKGVVKIANAHPFSFENVIGVHNGTLKSSFKNSEKYETDSQAIYSLLNEVEPEDVAEVIHEINKHDSAYVLVWVDVRDNSVNIIKNSQRTLWMTHIFSRTSLAFSSDKEHLKLGLKNAGVQTPSGVKPTDHNEDAFFQLKPHVHYKLKIGASVNTGTFTDLEIPEKKTYTYTGAGMGFGSYDDWEYSDAQKYFDGKALYKGPDGIYRERADHIAKIEALKAAKAAADKAAVQKEAKPTSYGNFHRKGASELANLPWLTKDLPKKDQEKVSQSSPGSDGAEPKGRKELEYKLGCGCCNCGTVVSLQDYEKGQSALAPAAYWYSRDYYVCSDCYENSPGDWIKYAINGEEPSVSVH